MVLKIEELTHVYMQGTPFELKALDRVNAEIHDGEFIGLIGHTGSGKSTLIQHLNGLLKPTSGSILLDGSNITKKRSSLNMYAKKLAWFFNIPSTSFLRKAFLRISPLDPTIWVWKRRW